jgi:predicted nuclease of predicted toxin-antitoxin system
MRLLFDQNISYRIHNQLHSSFSECKSVRDLDLVDATDHEIWNFARSNDYHILTFDADFSDIASILGVPPKIVWLRTGNMPTKLLVDLLKKHETVIKDFILNKRFTELQTLEIYF